MRVIYSHSRCRRCHAFELYYIVQYIRNSKEQVVAVQLLSVDAMSFAMLHSHGILLCLVASRDVDYVDMPFVLLHHKP